MPPYGINPDQYPAPFTAPATTASFTPPPPRPLYDLRPLSLGEILDRTFSLYKQRFWLYCGIAAVAASVTTLGTFARLTFGITSPTVQAAANPRVIFTSLAISIVTALLYFVTYSFIQAATVSAVTASYLGHQTTIATALRSVRPHWFRYVLIVLWQAFSATWITIVLGTIGVVLVAIPRLNLIWLGVFLLVLALLSFIYVVIAYIRNALGIVASVTEHLPVAAAMRRSKQLVDGSKGSVLAILLLMYVLNLVAGGLQAVFAIFFAMSHSTFAHIGLGALTLIMVFVTTSLVAPIPAIAFCIFYIDQRVRKEGFDLEVLMDRATPAPQPADLPFTFSDPTPLA